MGSALSTLQDFVSSYAGWLAIISITSFIVGLVLMPVFVSRIPADYFSQSRRIRQLANSRHPALQLLLSSAKNVLGIVLVLAGLLMLFIPGQGLLTLLVGLMIMNYPGKYALERWLIERPHVLRALNWLREKYGQVPLLPPDR